MSISPWRGSPEESPDPRCRTQDALQRVAAMIRDDPTLPAVVETPLVPYADALREDCAVELPRKHCAFRGCAFCGQTQEALDQHLADAHADVLVPVAKMLRNLVMAKEASARKPAFALRTTRPSRLSFDAGRRWRHGQSTGGACTMRQRP